MTGPTGSSVFGKGRPCHDAPLGGSSNNNSARRLGLGKVFSYLNSMLASGVVARKASQKDRKQPRGRRIYRSITSFILLYVIYLYSVTILSVSNSATDQKSLSKAELGYWIPPELAGHPQGITENFRPRFRPRLIQCENFLRCSICEENRPVSWMRNAFFPDLDPMPQRSIGGNLSEITVGLGSEAATTLMEDLQTNDNNVSSADDELMIEEDKGGSSVALTENGGGSSCVPLADWQSTSFPNCNSFHELDIRSALVPFKTRKIEPPIKFLGQGWFRGAWLYNNTSTTTSGEDAAVLKMLRFEREFLAEYFELHRRDAVAMERLTFSKFVMDIYGYCGQSALNELANFRPDVTSLEQLDRRLRGKKGDGIWTTQLRLATSVAVGLAHVHYVNQPRESGQTVLSQEHLSALPAIAHYDINPRNIAIVAGGKPKLNDFNIAEFLSFDPRTNKTCNFRSRLHEPWWRAPEEMDLTNSRFVDEKVDIYALGQVLYHIFTTHSPWGKMKKERMESVRSMVVDGVHPTLPPDIRHSNHPAHVAFRAALKLTQSHNPEERGNARDVATLLYSALAELNQRGDKPKPKR